MWCWFNLQIEQVTMSCKAILRSFAARLPLLLLLASLYYLVKEKITLKTTKK